jgi:DNA-binding transcriptional LysR family regulator
LRVTADAVFGEAFLPGLIAEYAGAYREVQVEVIVTSRYVDLVEEGFDVAFRVGRLADSSLVAQRLGDARLCYCASPAYLAARGAPETPDALRAHDCIELVPRAGPSKWPFRGPEGLIQVPVAGRVRVSSLPMARQAALAGLGITNLPAFACADDLRAGTLVAVLEGWIPDAGAVYVVHPQNRLLSARVRCFIQLALQRFKGALRARPRRSPPGP